MQTIFAGAMVVLLFVVPYPTIVWLLKRSSLPASRWLSALVGAGVGVGVLTWLMMAEGMLGIRWEQGTILLPFALIFSPGSLLWWRGRKHGVVDVSPPTTRPSHMIWLGRLVVTVVSAAVLFNALYWPFYKADAVGIYADQAHFMSVTRALIPLQLTNYSYYQAYPMLVQLSYTYTYIAAGWEDAYLAKLIPTLLSLGCLGAVFCLGKALYGDKAGWLAVLLLVFTPLFGRWASSGYADLPAAFYYTLAALFAWRLWSADHPADALVSGIMIGLGAWTKNALLAGVAFWLAFMGMAWLRRRIRFSNLCIAIAACGVIAAPWYIRNLLEAHLLMPATVWTSQAGRTIPNLLVFISHPENFALTGWLIVIGLVLGLVQLARHPRLADREMLLLTFTLPFFGFWWLLASYDRRFLLYFLPILVVLAAGYTLRIWERIPSKSQRVISWAISLAALAMTVYIVSISVDYKTAILRDPLMTDAAKRAIVLAPSKVDN